MECRFRSANLDPQQIRTPFSPIGSTRSQGELLKTAFEEIEEEEDEHLYHSKGWCRDLWIDWLGLNGVLPPPEEREHVKTAIGAARAEQSAPKKRSRAPPRDGPLERRNVLERALEMFRYQSDWVGKGRPKRR